MLRGLLAPSLSPACLPTHATLFSGAMPLPPVVEEELALYQRVQAAAAAAGMRLPEPAYGAHLQL